ncbi:Sphingosine kinase 1, partial [Linum grandiflorum]
GRPKRLLVFVNPYGGKRIAPKVYYDHVKPLLEDAGVQITLQGLKLFCFCLDISGLVADIDIESEKYRWMLFSLRQYNGRISFVPAPGFESYGEPFNHNSGLTSFHEKLVKVQPYGYHGPDLELLNREWRTIDGPFTSVWLHNVAWGGENTMAAPDAKV